MVGGAGGVGGRVGEEKMKIQVRPARGVQQISACTAQTRGRKKKSTDALRCNSDLYSRDEGLKGPYWPCLFALAG